MQKSGLGRGLSALIPDKIKKEQKTDTLPGNKQPTEIPLQDITPNAGQPRKKFKQEQLEELAESIKDYGILQPIVVTPKKEGGYEIIAGERRFRAATLIGLESVPAVIRESDAANQLELAIIENVQRENLNPIEEAQAYARLMQEFALTQEDVSQKVKKGRSSIANLLRYLTLPPEIQEGLIEGKITEGHAKVISALEDPEAQLALFRQTIKDNLAVRNLEDLAQEVNVSSHKRKIRPSSAHQGPLLSQKAKLLSDAFGLKVKITPKKKGGKIAIEYSDNNDLDRIVQQVSKN